MVRIYNQWPGNPFGSHGEPDRCIVAVYKLYNSIWPRFCQCSRPRGHGPDGMFCHLHAKALDKCSPLVIPDDIPYEQTPEARAMAKLNITPADEAMRKMLEPTETASGIPLDSYRPYGAGEGDTREKSRVEEALDRSRSAGQGDAEGVS
jgi:hypothetical protein